MTEPPAEPTAGQLNSGRLATLLVAVQAAIVAGLVVYYLVELASGDATDILIVLMSVVTMVVFVIGLAYTAKGLWARHPRAQAPALAFSFLLVPLGIAMFQFAPWWLAGAILALGVLTIVSVLRMGRL